jgi:hypothetical protein
MKPFDCEVCGKKASSADALVRWHYEPLKKKASILQIVHDRLPCSAKGEGDFFNRSLKMEYVFRNMPEFITYIKRLSMKEKELRSFVHMIEKDRSYIRRHDPDKKEVRKLIIRLEGMGEEDGMR